MGSPSNIIASLWISFSTSGQRTKNPPFDPSALAFRLLLECGDCGSLETQTTESGGWLYRGYCDQPSMPFVEGNRIGDVDVTDPSP